MAVAHRDVSMMSTPQVLTLLAEQSQRLRREVHSAAIVPSGGAGRAVAGGHGGQGAASGGAGGHGGQGHGITLRFRAATLLPGADVAGEAHIRRLSLTMAAAGGGVRGPCLGGHAGVRARSRSNNKIAIACGPHPTHGCLSTAPLTPGGCGSMATHPLCLPGCELPCS